ncbi:hypothetical protein JI739_12810 [Ramlibacter sp. AW1]|uniref:Uncharacterized protein n=1 Tax=Ramlibacter aurantiacus TaxID=2801330 RepID=A0A936ZK15_9BURK|nr:hypothetical protein [Ramlibacter aurantiacus]MBL0421232.1 hypothetical protein [Ramlibacter aurantiacus]
MQDVPRQRQAGRRAPQAPKGQDQPPERRPDPVSPTNGAEVHVPEPGPEEARRDRGGDRVWDDRAG